MFNQEAGMNLLKILGLVGGVGLLALTGGGIWWYVKHRRKQQRPTIRPSAPPREPTAPEPEPKLEDTRPRGHYVTRKDLNSELTKELNKLFDIGWPPDADTLDTLEPEDVIVFAAEGDEVGNYTERKQELISAKVLSVEKTIVRARILGPVLFCEHHGAFAGHGFRVGDLVEVPRSKVLVAARREPSDEAGYGSRGDPAATFEPSHETKKVYKVRPDTPYDLKLPYRTKELKWYIDRKLVKIEHVGEKGMLEQISFSEDSLRGEVSVRAIDEDPEVGAVFVARWDFELDA